MVGRVDLFHSRRVNYPKCPYWVRDERDASGPPSQWVLHNQPSGYFYAKPVSAKSSQMNVVNGVWAVDDSRVAIETDDDVVDIARGSIVEYAEELWLVESVQKQVHWKESEFCKHQDYKYTISLKKA